MRNLAFMIGMLCALTLKAQTSELASGNWFKLGIVEDGIYKLDRNFFRQDLNTNPNRIDPTTIRILGGYGGMLPQPNAEPISSLVEIPTYGVGIEDGSLDSEDYILFWAEGPDQKTWDRETGELSIEKNVYSDTTYVFVTYGGSSGLRMTTIENVSGTYPTIDTFEDYWFHEKDELNPFRSGRQWLGERFSNSRGVNGSFTRSFEGFTGTLSIGVSYIAQSDGDCSVELSVNDVFIGEVFLDSIKPVEKYPYAEKASTNRFDGELNIDQSDEVEFTFQFNPSPGNSILYLNNFLIRPVRSLFLYDNSTVFQSSRSLENPISTFEISVDSEDVIVWDITDAISPQIQEIDQSSNVVSFNAQSASLRNYVAFLGSNFPTPETFGRIRNQDIRSNPVPDGIIVTHPKFIKQANRLANFHYENDGLEVLVFTTQEVFNEFSAGRQDVTAIRNMARYFWSQSTKFKYLLLFGDASFDYKYRSIVNTNLVPNYQSRGYLDPLLTYSSDDYYGFLEDGEGEWIERSSGDHSLDIGVGRLPVGSGEEAEDVVTKIIRYSTSIRMLGGWKNVITYVADDGDDNLHVSHAEQLSRIFLDNEKQTQINKLYIDAIEQEIGPVSETTPEGRELLLRAIEDGTFVINFIGHGNEKFWASEVILDNQFVNDLTNRFKLPIFVTATCEYGRYDDPISDSGAEFLLFNPNGGAIALLTTSRPVYASSNLRVNIAFHESLFELEDGSLPRLGDVIRKTKNNSLRGVLNRNFSLLGDPMLRLTYPDYKISGLKINSRDLAMENDTISALEHIILEGKIIDQVGDTITDFNGKVLLTLLGAEQDRITLAQGLENEVPFNYTVQSNALFRGEASVIDGTFQIEFILPKNISYRYAQGKMVLYAWDEETGIDATGASVNMVIGGTADVKSDDNTPPYISIYLNDSTFRSGGSVGVNSLLIADLQDEHGINISNAGINQDITLRLNDGEAVSLNSYYTASLDDYQSGRVLYPLRNLSPGKYTASLKVWDTYNNSAEQTVDFVVSDKPRIRLFNVLNYPNPVYDQTTFSFEHDRLGEELIVTITLYNSMGRIAEQVSYTIDDSPKLVNDLTWTSLTSRLERGIYIYRITVKSTLDGAVGEEIKRLIIQN